MRWQEKLAWHCPWVLLAEETPAPAGHEPRGPIALWFLPGKGRGAKTQGCQGPRGGLAGHSRAGSNSECSAAQV